MQRHRADRRARGNTATDVLFCPASKFVRNRPEFSIHHHGYGGPCPGGDSAPCCEPIGMFHACFYSGTSVYSPGSSLSTRECECDSEAIEVRDARGFFEREHHPGLAILFGAGIALIERVFLKEQGQFRLYTIPKRKTDGAASAASKSIPKRKNDVGGCLREHRKVDRSFVSNEWLQLRSELTMRRS